MLTLIKREIRDHVVYFFAAVILAATLVGSLTISAYNYDSGESQVYLTLMIPGILLLLIGSAGMGVSQMYIDKNKKISAFLTSQPVTRSHILSARVITGILIILTVLVPTAIATVTLNNLLGPPIPVYGKLIADLFLTVFLMALACYSMGLLTGWTTSRVTPSFGGLGLTALLVSMIVIKGFGLEIKLLLALIIAASLTRTWRKFVSTPL